MVATTRRRMMYSRRDYLATVRRSLQCYGSVERARACVSTDSVRRHFSLDTQKISFTHQTRESRHLGPWSRVDGSQSVATTFE
jgi:hypothetical protein